MTTNYELQQRRDDLGFPLVRCRECRYFQRGGKPQYGYCDEYKIYLTADWFCADGERKVTDHDRD